MTDKERQKLCADLRNADLPDLVMCGEAADEIERLARDLRLAESARDYANDVLAYAKEQLADRSEK